MRIMIQRGGRVARACGEALPNTTGPRDPVARRRQLLVVSGWLLGVVVAFLCYLRLARTLAVDSDGASQALQAWDMLHGNVLLHGWWLSDVSFYTTELPEYILVELVRGLNEDVVHVAAALTYTLVLLVAALLAKGTATGRAGLARVLLAVGIMVAPQLGDGVKTLISSPDHIGTSVPVLVAFLILDHARAPRRRYVPVVIAALLGWAAIADTLVLFIGVLPVVLVGWLRAARPIWAERQWRLDRYYLVVAAAAAVAGAAAEFTLPVIREAGGFFVLPPPNRAVGVGALPHTANLAGQGLLLLTGSDFLGQRPGPATAAVFLHLVGVIVIGIGMLIAIRRFPHLSFVDQILVTAVAVNIASYVLSTQATSIRTTREMAAVLPFGAVLAGRMLADRVLTIRFAPAVLLLVLAGYLGGLGYELVQRPVPAQNHQLTSWLAAHHLSSGLSGYWAANVVTLTSGDRIHVRALTAEGPRLLRYKWNTDAAWYDPRSQTANFVVFGPPVVGNPGFSARAAVLATFGPPARTYHVGAYQVLVWHKNLLRELARTGSVY
jgi:hypothetical protein